MANVRQLSEVSLKICLWEKKSHPLSASSICINGSLHPCYVNPEVYSHRHSSPEISHQLGLESGLLHEHLIFRAVDFRVCPFPGGGRPTVPCARSHTDSLLTESERREPGKLNPHCRAVPEGVTAARTKKAECCLGGWWCQEPGRRGPSLRS